MTHDRSVGRALRALPDPAPPASLWRRIEVDLPAPGARRWLPWALAASVALIGLRLIVVDPSGVEPDPRFALLVAESRSLERLVGSHPIASSGTRIVLVERLADLDGQLSEALLVDADEKRALGLLERRVALLRALADVDQRSVRQSRRNVRPAVY